MVKAFHPAPPGVKTYVEAVFEILEQVQLGKDVADDAVVDALIVITLLQTDRVRDIRREERTSIAIATFA